MGEMNEWIQQVFKAGDPPEDLGVFPLLVRLLTAFALGCVVACIYRFTQARDAPAAPSFVATLVLLCVLLAMVTQVIGNSAARAFSLVGILSIVRFRTTVEDTRDTAFVIFAVIVGMAAGVGQLSVALVGLAVVGIAALLLRLLPATLVKQAPDWSLVLRISTGAGADSPWEAVLARHCARVQLLGTATARQGAALELTYKLQLEPGVTPLQMLNDINRLEGMQNVELKRNP